jgi:hypothetical protein
VKTGEVVLSPRLEIQRWYFVVGGKRGYVCWLGGGRCRGSGRFGLVGGGVSFCCVVVLLCCVFGIDVVGARKICHDMQLMGSIRAWGEGVMYFRPSCVCSVSVPALRKKRKEKKCDVHAGPLDFGIGLVSFCYRPRLGRTRVGAGFGVGVKEDDK